MNHARRLAASVLSIALVGMCSAVSDVQVPTLQYPTTRTVAVVDDYFDTKVADPYRQLEEVTATVVTNDQDHALAAFT